MAVLVFCWVKSLWTSLSSIGIDVMVGRPVDVLRWNFVEVTGEKQEAKKTVKEVGFALRGRFRVRAKREINRDTRFIRG